MSLPPDVITLSVDAMFLFGTSGNKRMVDYRSISEQGRTAIAHEAPSVERPDLADFVAKL
jgi:hypothetical protein